MLGPANMRSGACRRLFKAPRGASCVRSAARAFSNSSQINCRKIGSTEAPLAVLCSSMQRNVARCQAPKRKQCMLGRCMRTAVHAAWRCVNY